MAMDPLEVLIKKRARLDIAFTFNMKELADLMNREGFLSGPDYDKVIEVKSMYSDKEKAGIMVSSLIKKVELNPKKYGRFLGLVKQGGRKFEDVVDLLDVLPSNGERTEQEPRPQQPHIQPSTMDSRGSSGAGASLKAENITLVMVDDKVLVEDDILDILDEIEFLSADWEMIGTKIGMKADTKKGIKQQYESPNSRLNALLTEWLQLNYDHGRHGKPSWRKLAKAVQTINGAAYENLVKRHVKAHPQHEKVVEDGAGSSPTPAAGVRDGEGRLTVDGCPALGNKLKLQKLQLLKYKTASGSEKPLRILDDASFK